MDDSAAGAIFWRNAGIHLTCDSHSALWGFSSVECPLVVHSFLQCIVGLNECTRKHPLWFRTPLKIAVGIGAISDTALVFPCTGVDTMADSSQFTQGGSNVRWSCQSTIVGGGLCRTTSFWQGSQNSLFEEEDFKIGIYKKTTGWICIIIGWMCTHTPTHSYVQTTCKVNFASDDP